MKQDTVDRQVAHLLHTVAEDVPNSVNLLPRVQRQMASSVAEKAHGARTRMTAPLHIAPRWGYVVLSGVLVAGILFSAFAFARPLIFSWLGDSGLRAISLGNAPVIGASATRQGITLLVEQAYADAARTAITMRIQAPKGQQTVTPRIDISYLLDSHGRRYAALTATQVGEEGLIEFVPLSSDTLDSEQALQLVVPSVFSPDASSPITGPWQIPFQVHSQAARSTIFTGTSITRNGVTVQPERLDLAPAGSRLLIRVSGLAADTSLASLTQFARYGGDAIAGCAPNKSSPCVISSSTSSGALLRLQGAEQQTLEPSWVAVADPATSDVGVLPAANQVVGPSGSAVIEVLFFTPLHATGGVAHLTIDRLDLRAMSVDTSGQAQVATGPWTFALALA